MTSSLRWQCGLLDLAFDHLVRVKIVIWATAHHTDVNFQEALPSRVGFFYEPEFHRTHPDQSVVESLQKTWVEHQVGPRRCTGLVVALQKAGDFPGKLERERRVVVPRSRTSMLTISFSDIPGPADI